MVKYPILLILDLNQWVLCTESILMITDVLESVGDSYGVHSDDHRYVRELVGDSYGVHSDHHRDV